VVWEDYPGDTGARMTDASREEILAFVGSLFGSVEQTSSSAHATDGFPPQGHDQVNEAQGATTNGDGCRGMDPMARFLACNEQPLQIAVARLQTGRGRGN
jgi:hypothetical protein